ncbi:MAG TPA: hypothetical protein VIZ69_00060 [Thermoanaerobaculia bacterium]
MSLSLPWLILLAVAVPGALVLLVLLSGSIAPKARLAEPWLALILGAANLFIGFSRLLSHPASRPSRVPWMEYSTTIWAVLAGCGFLWWSSRLFRMARAAEGPESTKSRRS